MTFDECSSFLPIELFLPMYACSGYSSSSGSNSGREPSITFNQSLRITDAKPSVTFNQSLRMTDAKPSVTFNLILGKSCGFVHSI